MNIEELDQYIEENSTAKTTFEEKALAFQQAKNEKRAFAKRWKPGRLQRQVDLMWTDILDNFYKKLAAAIKKTNSPSPDAWVNFIVENEILDELAESMDELSFDEE